MTIRRLFVLTAWCAAITFALWFGAAASAQPALDWSTLGASATTIINTGQTFTDIGTTLGRADLVGVDLTVSYSGTGLGSQKVRINDSTVDPDQWNLFNGTLSFVFGSPVRVRFEGGGSILAGEVDTFGPGANGLLTSSHPEVGLTVTDDSVGNPTANAILTNTLVWVSGPGTSYTHSVTAQNEGARLFIPVPEPSNLLLVGIGLIAHAVGRRTLRTHRCLVGGA